MEAGSHWQEQTERMSKRDVRPQQAQFLKGQERRGQNREFVWWYL